ncbi:MAG: sel1 repeat family protein, partial [Hyphomicrobiales bacterium]|nr:sel1 repeat family protein [Hyphomicrobiales bacterium]
QLSQDEEQKLLERAASLVEIGEIASARLMFEHLARQGSGLGALALAQTYDPIYFRSMKTLGGPAADIEQARIWYRIAAELGQSDANARLSALAGN